MIVSYRSQSLFHSDQQNLLSNTLCAYIMCVSICLIKFLNEMNQFISFCYFNSSRIHSSSVINIIIITNLYSWCSVYIIFCHLFVIFSLSFVLCVVDKLRWNKVFVCLSQATVLFLWAVFLSYWFSFTGIVCWWDCVVQLVLAILVVKLCSICAVWQQEF